MKTLMHICCAPCSVYCIESLRAEGIEPVGFWYNPTIHPYTEYRSRRDCLRSYAEQVNLTLIEQDEYGLRDFVRRVADHIEGRCADCYAIRLEQAAAYAAANGYDSFTTTLLVSPYQKHELIRQIGERLAEQYGVQFLYRDFRVGFQEGQEKARKAELYMQKYCGCIFSEEDRYIRNRPLQKPPVQIFPKPVNPKKLARMQKAAANAAARVEHERLQTSPSAGESIPQEPTGETAT